MFMVDEGWDYGESKYRYIEKGEAVCRMCGGIYDLTGHHYMENCLSSLADRLWHIHKEGREK